MPAQGKNFAYGRTKSLKRKKDTSATRDINVLLEEIATVRTEKIRFVAIYIVCKSISCVGFIYVLM